MLFLHSIFQPDWLFVYFCCPWLVQNFAVNCKKFEYKTFSSFPHHLTLAELKTRLTLQQLPHFCWLLVIARNMPISDKSSNYEGKTCYTHTHRHKEKHRSWNKPELRRVQETPSPLHICYGGCISARVMYVSIIVARCFQQVYYISNIYVPTTSSLVCCMSHTGTWKYGCKAVTFSRLLG